MPKIMATTPPLTFSMFAPLDDAVATVEIAKVLLLLGVELPLDLIALSLSAVAELDEVVADFELAVEDIAFSKLPLIRVAEDNGVEAEVAMVVAAVVKALPLGVINSTVWVLSTTNCRV